MVINTKITIKRNLLHKKIKIINNKSIFKILEVTQNKALTIDEVVSEVKIAKAKVEAYLGNLNKLGIIEKSRDGRLVKIKSKINLDKLSKIF